MADIYRLTASGHQKELSLSDRSVEPGAATQQPVRVSFGLKMPEDKGRGAKAKRSGTNGVGRTSGVTEGSSFDNPYRKLSSEPSSVGVDLGKYREKLPRRRRKTRGCWGLSGYSWLFLLLALSQGEWGERASHLWSFHLKDGVCSPDVQKLCKYRHAPLV